MSRLTVVRGGTIVQGDRQASADVLVEDGAVAAVGRDLSARGATEIDAAGCLVLPGVIDAHVQFGIKYRDTLASDDFERGSLAAAAGGVTSFIDFAVPAKGAPPLEALLARLDQAEGKVSTDFSLHSSSTGTPARQHGSLPWDACTAPFSDRRITDTRIRCSFSAHSTLTRGHEEVR